MFSCADTLSVHRDGCFEQEDNGCGASHNTAGLLTHKCRGADKSRGHKRLSVVVLVIVLA